MKNVVVIIMSLLLFFCQTVYAEPSLQSVSVNDVIKMGKYNINSMEEKEEIEWIVLAVEDNKALLFSRYVIDATMYSTINQFGYKNSKIRKFLNEDFMNCFTKEEREKIIPTFVNVAQTWEFNIDRSKDFEYAFLLGSEEINTYFKGESDVDKGYIYGFGTMYARLRQLQCIEINDGILTSPYWLRSEGFNDEYAQVVSYNGKVLEDGYFYHRYNCGLRPAMWVELQ